jgi:hypothetical protein
MLPRIINFDIKGVVIALFSGTLEYMPYLKKCAEEYTWIPDTQGHLTNNIILDSNILSPSMIRTIATHLINNNKMEILKRELLEQYEEKYIEESLMYLCGTQLLTMIFPEKSVVDNKIYKIVVAWRCMVYSNIKIIQFKLLSGDMIEEKEEGLNNPDNYLLLLESYNNKPMIQSAKGWKYFCIDLYKNINNVIMSNDEYYITPITYEKITQTKIF